MLFLPGVGLLITTRRQPLSEERLQAALHQSADNETTLVAPILSDQSTDCCVSSSAFKYWISVC